MFIETIVVGPLQENSYVVACEETQEAAIIDPGAEADRIYRVVTFHGFTLKYVLNTHGHPDHVGGVADIIEKTGVPFFLHQDDMYLIEGFEQDPIRAFLAARTPPPPDRFLQDGDMISVGNLEFHVLHTPGHTPGGVCFLVQNVLFSGDTLFANSIGRTDLPGGNHQQLLTSIRDKLLSLDDAVRVYSGHGYASTIGNERQFNPFF
jgi:glyoxylase-like metal-dependent hydrolase (beta-lactamase superfamily II)